MDFDGEPFIMVDGSSFIVMYLYKLPLLSSLYGVPPGQSRVGVVGEKDHTANESMRKRWEQGGWERQKSIIRMQWATNRGVPRLLREREKKAWRWWSVCAE